MKGKKILFFTAAFLGFQEDIKKALEAMGAEVDWYNERVSNSTFTKAVIRFNRNYLNGRIKAYYEDVIKKTSSKTYDYVFFVNVEAASKDIIDELRIYQPKAKYILYEWDSIVNNSNARNMLGCFDEVWSFDKNDCNDFSMNFLPLFYNNEYANIKNDKNKYHFGALFVGTTHSDRYAFVKSIVSQIASFYENSFAWFYFPSKLLFYKMWLTDKQFRKIAVPSDFKYTPIPKPQLLTLVEQSRIIIDAQHPKQTGLTMRTIETLGARRKLITTNVQVKEYDFYNPQNILVVDRANPVVPQEFVTSEYVDVDKNIYQKYSLDNWLRTIFNHETV